MSFEWELILYMQLAKKQLLWHTCACSIMHAGSVCNFSQTGVKYVSK